MNIDWFNPYKNALYSVWAVYFVILNLPREERFKLENVILASVIPGPNESTGTINTFLSPTVSDLSRLYESIMIQTPTSCISFAPLRAILMHVYYV